MANIMLTGSRGVHIWSNEQEHKGLAETGSEIRCIVLMGVFSKMLKKIERWQKREKNIMWEIKNIYREKLKELSLISLA